MNGLELSPRDQEIFSWWDETGKIYLLLFADDDLFVNLWEHYLKYFNFIEGCTKFARRPGDFLLVGWGLGYLFCVPCSWWFDWKSMKKLSKKYFNWIERFGGFTRRPGDFLLVGWGWKYLFFWIDFHLVIRIVSWSMLWLEIYENMN